MITKEFIEKAKKCTAKEDLLKLAKVDNIELNSEDINNLLTIISENGQLFDEEIENVTGGNSCYSSETYSSLRITPSACQLLNNHPVLVKLDDHCSDPAVQEYANCGVCPHSVNRENAIYCDNRSFEYDPYR